LETKIRWKKSTSNSKTKSVGIKSTSNSTSKTHKKKTKTQHKILSSACHPTEKKPILNQNGKEKLYFEELYVRLLLK